MKIFLSKKIKFLISAKYRTQNKVAIFSEFPPLIIMSKSYFHNFHNRIFPFASPPAGPGRAVCRLGSLVGGTGAGSFAGSNAGAPSHVAAAAGPMAASAKAAAAARRRRNSRAAEGKGVGTATTAALSTSENASAPSRAGRWIVADAVVIPRSDHANALMLWRPQFIHVNSFCHDPHLLFRLLLLRRRILPPIICFSSFPDSLLPRLLLSFLSTILIQLSSFVFPICTFKLFNHFADQFFKRFPTFPQEDISKLLLNLF